MTHTLALIRDAADTIPIHVLAPDDVDAFLAELPDAQQTWAGAQGFTGKLGASCLLPAPDGAIASVLVGWGKESERARGRLHLAGLATSLPQGNYHFATLPVAADHAALSWLLGSYRFDRYKPGNTAPNGLAAAEALDVTRVESIAAAVAKTQDLINTPASDMGPEALENAVCKLSEARSATLAVTRGDDLLSANFPMIHAVGRAAQEAPRLLDLTWGNADAPKVTIVGKGVCFDTGGLNLKPGNSMALMKKDMGGAATAIGLASMIMTLDLPVRLRLLIPAVENAVAGNAFRPGDVLTARNGKTVEINNTDAEGRLVLADALALAGEEEPEHMISLATLTGAARVAVGPDLAPYYTTDDGFAARLESAAATVADPVWRMPFHDPYEAMIEPQIADLDNAPAGGFAGSITAALFLRRFAGGAKSYTHFDIYGWTPAPKPGRPKGGACQAARALFYALEDQYDALSA